VRIDAPQHNVQENWEACFKGDLSASWSDYWGEVIVIVKANPYFIFTYFGWDQFLLVQIVSQELRELLNEHSYFEAFQDCRIRQRIPYQHQGVKQRYKQPAKAAVPDSGEIMAQTRHRIFLSWVCPQLEQLLSQAVTFHAKTLIRKRYIVAAQCVQSGRETVLIPDSRTICQYQLRDVSL
jgi:hypothetical protein